MLPTKLGSFGQAVLGEDFLGNRPITLKKIMDLYSLLRTMNYNLVLM